MYLNNIAPGRLLEVGCGNGKRLARMRDLGWDVTGQEIDSVASEYVRQEKGIPVHLGPLETMDTPGEFDVVILSHVIEHLHDPVALLKMCHLLLKKNGLLVLLTPNVASYGHRKFGAGWRDLESPRHIHLFTCKTLVRLAQKSGFSNPNSWTTPIGAYGIGQSSSSSAETTKAGCQFMATRDVLRGFWFQLAAHLVFQFDKNSGEECVLMATK
ncbi:MAG: class I SAM-dependent methyltransferase [Nitrosomonas sp.]|nr:class I SAM-dependent methyltransferase [Nitrosomonas sp.]MDP3664643.1 class I SAM-dependent methyltransferase [Nitrosomonas sp.]MDZ4106124.1 class I SAM-dependent methyltransferase [Nitrosomonas sp.]